MLLFRIQVRVQMVNVHINNTKHITIANIYIPPRDSTSMHYKTADTDIQHCIQYITNIPHSVVTGNMNAHSTLWYSYPDYHRGQLIVEVISKIPHYNKHHDQISPRCLTHCTTGHHGQLNTHYHQTTYPSSPQLTYDMTAYYKNDGLSSTTRKLIGHKSQKPAFVQTTIPTNIHTANIIFTNIILMADKHNIPKGKMHSNCRLLPEHIVCKITQRQKHKESKHL